MEEEIRGTGGSIAWADERTLFYVKLDAQHRPFEVRGNLSCRVNHDSSAAARLEPHQRVRPSEGVEARHRHGAGGRRACLRGAESSSNRGPSRRSPGYISATSRLHLGVGAGRALQRGLLDLARRLAALHRVRVQGETPPTHLRDTPPRHLRDTPPTHLRHTSDTPPTHLPDTAQTPPRHRPDASQTPPRHLPDTSQTPPRRVSSPACPPRRRRPRCSSCRPPRPPPTRPSSGGASLASGTTSTRTLHRAPSSSPRTPTASPATQLRSQSKREALSCSSPPLTRPRQPAALLGSDRRPGKLDAGRRRRWRARPPALGLPLARRGERLPLLSPGSPPDLSWTSP